MNHTLVMQSDFGLGDGAVSAMYGVIQSVDRSIPIFDLTHDIPQYNIWEASYRLLQTVTYWPTDTIFVSVVDPGVGTDRQSIVAKTASNHYIVTPDNGTLTHINNNIGIVEVRTIDESLHRLPQSGASHTFHGRDIYAYTGAKLASKEITFKQIGPKVALQSIQRLPVSDAAISDHVLSGSIDILDVRFGNLWTNISLELFEQLDVKYGDTLDVTIETDTRKVYKNFMTYGRSFADISVGEPLVYVNSLDNLGVAINQGSFANAYNIGTGSGWKISLRKAPKITYNIRAIK